MGKRSDWMGTYGCCSNKEITYYYCIGCKTIQHRSCVERKNFISVKDYKIYCSKKCEDQSRENYTESEIELVQELREIITELNGELKQKSLALERKQRNSAAFEMDVEEAEQRYKEELTKQQEQISTLQEELTEELTKSDDEAKKLREHIAKMEMEHKNIIQNFKQNQRGAEKSHAEKQKQKDQTIEKLNDQLKNLTMRLEDEVKKSGELEQKNEILASKAVTSKVDHQNLDNELTNLGEKKSIESDYTNIIQYEKKINEYKCHINRLEEELKKHKEKEFYDKDNEKYKEEIDELKRRIGRTNLMNNSIKKSMERIEKENIDLKSKLKQLRTGERAKPTREPDQSENHSQTRPDEHSQSRKTQTNTNRNHKAQILILGGTKDYNYGKMFKAVSESRFDTNCQHNENSNLLEDIIENHEVLSRRFNKSDYKIILTHHENARQGKKITLDLLQKLIRPSQNTNTIIVGALFVPGKIALNHLIQQQNKHLENYVREQKDVIYVDINRVLKPYQIEEGHVTSSGKWRLVNYINRYYIQTTSKSTQTDIQTSRNLREENRNFQDLVHQEAPSIIQKTSTIHTSDLGKMSRNIDTFLWQKPSRTETNK